MNQDEKEIRDLIAPWMSASAAGDLETVLTVFRKESDGRWRLYRDANLLTTEGALGKVPFDTIHCGS